jgi:hypothetical protein
MSTVNDPDSPFFETDHGLVPSQPNDNDLLAGLFRRAVESDLLTIEMRFLPTYGLELRAGKWSSDREPVMLTDAEIDALRRLM